MTGPAISPATTAQLKLHTHHQLFPDDASFNLSRLYRITGDVDVERLRAALGRLARSIHALNATFESTDGAVHAIRRAPEADLDALVPLTVLPGNAEEVIARLIAEQSDTPIPPGGRQYAFHVYRDDEAAYATVLFSHLVNDGYSYFNFLSELERLYADPEAALPPSVDDGPASFTDAAPPSADALEFFRTRLGHLTTLGDDRLQGRRTASGARIGDERSLELDAELRELILTRTKELGCTPFAFFLAAYLVTYARVTGGRELVTGIPLANRRGLRQRQAYGYFVNTLPLAVDLTEHGTFEELCRAVQSTTVGMLRHQSFDLGAHAREVSTRLAGGLLSTDNTFTYYKEPLRFRLDGATVESVPLPRRQVKYPLSMNVEDSGTAFVLNAECSDEQWRTDPLSVMRHVLTVVAQDPKRRIEEIPALSVEAERELFALVNPDAGGEPFEVPPSLAAWFERTARAHPQRIAVRDRGEELTYAELGERAARVAARLSAATDSPDVGIAMRRGVDLIAVILGTLMARKAYVPLDPNSPVSRIDSILESFPGGLPIVVDAEHWPSPVSRFLPAAPLLAPAPAGGSSAGPAPQDDPDACAYVIFTSGSTGRPKGVQVTHRNVMRLMRSCEGHFGFGPQDTWSLFHSYAFDFSVWEIFGALLYGGRLAIVPEDCAKSPDQFREFLVREQVTVLSQTPSGFGQLMKVLEPGDGERLAVRYVVFGGEALRYASLNAWYEVMGERAQLVNMYGITETTVHVTHHPVTPQSARTEVLSAIGRPLPDLTVTVVDTDGNICPPGVPGELVVGGAGVSLGYLGLPELTAERFPVLGGKTLYRSGDLGMVRPDGTLVHLGRIDKQVQLRGFRIELGEIETALLSVPGVRECTVRLDERDPEHPRLVAFAAGASLPEPGEIRQALRERLPSYMVPAQFVRSAALPLTLNGKIDDAALPWPAVPAAALEQGAPGVPCSGAGNGTEAAVHAIWGQVLPGIGIGPEDNFFDIGGSSMHVVQVHRLLQEHLAVPGLEMIELYTHTTVRRLAAHIDAVRGDSR
ncbi:amino acid adenylation domain-containing protein [Streptomyces sp. ITFR-6]|uniref:non-ribosomal peptide synthetase n=1 Tax=Streptomyces sp. ITFR-6 TaxID=3075197 RepID=UPI00288ACCDB|nr:amino acid adenylation domain-containing protein [Streptomyces sp. ITFR-6]WNI30980.1 amino acid adenylation domain-containing protein [Streptomyces sp. ITFR-6]